MIIRFGYGAIAIPFGVFVIYLIRGFIQPGQTTNWKNWLLPAAAILLGSLWVLSIEPFSLKIISDEALIASTGQMMHAQRVPAVPQVGNWSSSTFVMGEAFLDKRPFFLPFLISILHDLKGYQFQNIFVLNAGLTALFLGISWGLVSRFASRQAALLFLILIIFFPVLGQGATSGNASILNITLISASIFLALLYYEQPDERRLTPLVYALILLAQTRYESSVLILPFGIFIIAGWMKVRRIIMPIPVAVSPLFLILTAIHQRYALEFGKFYWQAGPGGRSDTFSLEYLGINLRSTWDFAFSLGTNHPNSPILSILGTSGLAVLLGGLLLRKIPADKRPVIFLLIALFLHNFATILFFNFGIFTEYTTSRLSLPFHYFLALFAVLAFHYLPKHLIRLAIILLVAVIFVQTYPYTKANWESNGIVILFTLLGGLGGGFFLLEKGRAHSWKFSAVTLILSLVFITPKLRNQSYSHAYAPSKSVALSMDFIRENAAIDTLFLHESPIIPILLKQNGAHPGAFFNSAQRRPIIEEGHYQHVYYLYNKIDNASPDAVLGSRDWMKPPDEFEAIPITQTRLTEGFFFKVVELKLSTKDPIEANDE